LTIRYPSSVRLQNPATSSASQARSTADFLDTHGHPFSIPCVIRPSVRWLEDSHSAQTATENAIGPWATIAGRVAKSSSSLTQLTTSPQYGPEPNWRLGLGL